MKISTRYCLDADSLITIKNGPYGFDLWPDFWAFLGREIETGRVYACSWVYKEWREGNDDLAEWVKDFRTLGLSTIPDTVVQTKYRQIVNSVQGQFSEERAAQFLAGADPWTIAQAWKDQSTVVTFEKRVGADSKKIKIPNICDQYAVKCINIYEMLRELKRADP